jgi:hypothetical protein
MERLLKFECMPCGSPLLTDQPAGARVRCGWCRSTVEVAGESPFTESDFLTADDAYLLLQFARRHASDRKLWLFAYACSRRILERVAAALDRAEGNPGEAPSRKKARQAAQLIDDVRLFLNGGSDGPEQPSQPQPQPLASAVWGPSSREMDDDEIAAQMALLRDVVGNPFRPVTIADAVLAANDGAAVKLAQAIFDGRTFAEKPVLADALEEAGCAERAILDHLRSAGPHVGGCWAIDLILGKG